MRRAACAVAAALLLASASSAGTAVSPATVGYQPVGKDEQGLWAEMAEAERELKASKFLIRDPALHDYLRGVVCRLVTEEKCRAIRIYVVRDASFNASMMPNGVMQVHSGLLLRMRDEAELASVLGHEFAHFERRHSLEILKKARSASGWAAFLSAAGAFPAAFMMVGSFFSFSQEQEREADLDGLKALKANGYRTKSAADVWANLRAEMDATAAARKIRSRKDRRGMFETHPATAERLAYLQASAASDPDGNRRQASYHAAIAAHWPMLIDDQIKLNDFGGTEYLLAGLASGAGWTGPLLFARGELYRSRGADGDFEKAAGFYREAIAQPDAPDAAWRGLGLALARAGDTLGAKAAIDDYLKRKPDASDKAMLAMITGGAQ